MKKPNVKACPCCEIEMRTDPALMLARTVKPICKNQMPDADGALTNAELYWQCQMCGCEWRHGQFDDRKGKR